MIQKNDLVRIEPSRDFCGSGLSYGTVYEVQDVRENLVRLHAPMQTPSFRFMPADSLIVIGRVEQADDVDAEEIYDHQAVYNAPGAGVKHDCGKLQWNLLPLSAFRGAVRVLMIGAKKYAPWNWRAGMPYSQTYNALQRHLDAWMEGENLDPESGENHLDHAICELMFLRTHVQEGTGTDDRFTK